MSIYTRPQRFPISLVVGEAYSPQQLPFTAHGVIVYNHSDQHLLLEDENLFAPPKVSGWMMPIADAGSANVKFAAPPSAPDPSPTPGQVCTLIFTEEDVAPNAGVPDGQISVVHPWTPCGAHTTTAPFGADGFTTSPVPIDAQQLQIKISDEFNGFFSFQVFGHQSGMPYLETTSGIFPVSGVFVVPIDGSTDSTYDIAWSGSPHATAQTIRVSESALPPGFAALGPQPQAMSIPVTLPPDQAIGKSGRQTAALSAPVVVQDEASVSTFGVALAAGATQDLVSALAGQTVYALEFHATISTAAPAVVLVEDDNGNTLCRFRTDNVGEVSRSLRGVHGTAGHKVRLHNTAGVAAGAIDGELVFVQF